MPARQENYIDPFAHLTCSQQQVLYSVLTSLISDQRRQLFDRLAPNRTRHICVVLEDIYQSHNASAVLRSCDCFGVQDVHVVEQHNQYTINPEIAMGSNKWVDYYLHHDIPTTYDLLHQKGYKIVATLPHENDTLIADLDIRQPVALVFGTELTGLSQQAITGADAYVKIPMYGFTESFNISVASALSLFSLTERMRTDKEIAWQLSETAITNLKLHWCMQTIKEGPAVVKKMMDNLFS